MSLTSESVFRPGIGEQELETTVGSTEYKTTITLSYIDTGTQAMEIVTDPRGTGDP